MIRKYGIAFIVLGIFSVLFFVFADLFGTGNGQKSLGAAQIFGIEFGIALIVIGIGGIIHRCGMTKPVPQFLCNMRGKGRNNDQKWLQDLALIAFKTAPITTSSSGSVKPAAKIAMPASI